MRNLVLWAQLFHYGALKIGSLTDDVAKLSELEHFKDRIEWAEKKWEHLSSGGSRIVYKLPDGKVLKLAKNKKGLAQNKAESNPKMKSQYINPTLKSDKEGVWKISPWADKVTEKEFEAISGINFKDFGEAIEYGLRKVSDSDKKKPKHFEEIAKNEMYKELVELGKEFDLLPGDLSRISSWGQKDGQAKLLDSGLTVEIFDQFYEDDGSSSK